jgi:hypothetical protein
MSEIAAGLGSVICRSAIDVGFSGAHCYNWDTQLRLGYAALAMVVVVIAAAGMRRFGHSA